MIISAHTLDLHRYENQRTEGQLATREDYREQISGPKSYSKTLPGTIFPLESLKKLKCDSYDTFCMGLKETEELSNMETVTIRLCLVLWCLDCGHTVRLFCAI